MDNENLTETETKAQKRNFILLTGAVFLAYAFFGFSDTSRGTAFPRIQADLDITELQLGLLMAVNSIGYLIACSYTAVLARKIGIKSCMIIALLVQACSGLLICFSPNFEILVLAFFVLNIGNGMLDISTSVIAATTFTKRTGTMMSVAHSFYGFGSILAPTVSVSLMLARFGDQILGWRYMYLIVLSFAIIPAAFALLGRIKKQDYNKKQTGFAAILKKPALWLTVLILAFGTTAEMGIVGWFQNFLEKSYSFSVEKAGNYLTLFLVCFTVTRLLIGPIIDKVGFINILTIATAFAGVMVTAGVLLGERGTPLLFIAGVGIAPIFPTVMAVIAKLFTDEIDLAMTSILTTMGIIMIPANFMIGGIVNQARLIFTESHGEAGVGMAFAAGYMFVGLCCFASCLFTIILKVRQKRLGQVV